MFTDADLAILEYFLEIIGAFIVLAVAYISYRGYRGTGSPSMLRLMFAFLLLGVSFALTGIVGFSSIGMLPILTISITSLLLVSAVLEASGYFFLAFSHIMNAKVKYTGFVSSLAITSTLPVDVLKSVSLFFLLYGITETVLSYIRVRKVETLLIACAFLLLATAELIKWTSFLFPSLTAILAVSLLIRMLGFFALYVPVMRVSS